MREPLLTVFTPAFNRAHLLPRLYDALQRQTCTDFIWLIIDDGSSDTTRELVGGWICEKKLTIQYHYKENGGMHTAHNAAYERIETELNTCIDSDDWMPDDAVGKIVECWKKNGSDKYSGMIALDAVESGELIGSELPKARRAIRLCDFYANGGTGDKKLIFRTEVMKKYPPYPIFEGENYVGLNFKYTMADQDYTLLILNEVVCIVEYQLEGSSHNMIHQYRKNPQGFSFIRKVDMQFACTLKLRIKAAIHYVAKSMMLKNIRFLKESPCKFLTIIAIPAGVLLYVYIMRTKTDSPFKGT